MEVQAIYSLLLGARSIAPNRRVFQSARPAQLSSSALGFSPRGPPRSLGEDHRHRGHPLLAGGIPRVGWLGDWRSAHLPIGRWSTPG